MTRVEKNTKHIQAKEENDALKGAVAEPTRRLNEVDKDSSREVQDMFRSTKQEKLLL